MRQPISTLFAVLFFLIASSSAQAVAANGKDLTVKKPLIKEDLTKSTRSIKKVKTPKVSQKQTLKNRAPAAMKEKKNVLAKGDNAKALKKSKKGKVISAKKPSPKKYWSVECRQGFIKDSYVYCARKPASTPVAKKPVIKKTLAKKTKTSIRK